MARTHARLPLLLFLLHAAAISAAPLERSSISAAPESLPRLPKHSAFPPALSPDTMPLLPSPGGEAPPPSGILPTIPSSPSPPNPDALEPNSALAPIGSAAAVAAAESPATSLRVHVAWALSVGLVAMWLVQAGVVGM